MKNILFADYTKTKSTWMLRLFNKLQFNKGTFNMACKDKDIIIVHCITPINDREVDFAQIEMDLRKYFNTILVSLPEDYTLEMGNFYIKETLLGHIGCGDYLEFGHPCTYCSNIPKQVTDMEKLARNLGNKVFYSLDDCANYLNEMINDE